MVQPGRRAGRSQLVAPLEFLSVTNADNLPVVHAGGNKEPKRRWKASISRAAAILAIAWASFSLANPCQAHDWKTGGLWDLTNSERLGLDREKVGSVANFRNDFRLALEDDHLSKVYEVKGFLGRLYQLSLAPLASRDSDLDEVHGWDRRSETDRFMTCGTFLGGYRRGKENRSVGRDFFHERALPWTDDWMETGTWSKPSSDWAFEFKGPRAGNDDCWDESPALVPEPNPSLLLSISALAGFLLVWRRHRGASQRNAA
jgi:hypothetical protein